MYDIIKMPANKRKLRIPDGVVLQECSVVIIGSRCKICGRDFKCMSDVNMHTNWRHNGTIKSLYDNLDKDTYLGNFNEICDVCNEHFETASELKRHKKLIHNHVNRKRRNKKGRVLVRFKLKGAITREVYLDRKYLNIVLSQNDIAYLVDVGVQTENSEDEKRQDVFVTNIDFSLTNYIVDNGHVEYNMPPHKDANRYIVGKFASTKGDAVAPSSAIGGRSPIEISSALYKDARRDSGNFSEKSANDSVSEEDSLILPSSFVDDMNICDKENSRSITHESENVYYRDKLLLDDSKLRVSQQDKFTETLSMSAETSLLNRHDSVRRINEDSVHKAKSSGSLIGSMEIVTAVENTYNERKHLPVSRKQEVKESVKANINVDDDVREVLRITRRHIRSDINHESPTRTEREILVRNVIEETFPTRQKLQINPEKCNISRAANFKAFGYSQFMNVENNTQLFDSFDKKVSMYFEDLNRYGISIYNDFPEINNNIEECVKYPQEFSELEWNRSAILQSTKSRYNDRLKSNDNNETIVILE